jgi:hypothetical protein
MSQRIKSHPNGTPKAGALMLVARNKWENTPAFVLPLFSQDFQKKAGAFF